MQWDRGAIRSLLCPHAHSAQGAGEQFGKTNRVRIIWPRRAMSCDACRMLMRPSNPPNPCPRCAALALLLGHQKARR